MVVARGSVAGMLLAAALLVVGNLGWNAGEAATNALEATDAPRRPEPTRCPRDWGEQAARANLERAIEEMDARVAAAIDQIMEAQDDASRGRALSNLTALRRSKDELLRRVAAERAALAGAKARSSISKECVDHPLATDCW